MRIYRCWLEYYDTDENTHRRAVERVRECEDEPTGVPTGGATDPSNGEGGRNGGDGGGTPGPKPKPKPKPNATQKKEKTEDQLARGVPQLNHDFPPILYLRIASFRLPSL